MKKFIIAMLCVAVLFGFAACDNSTGNPADTDTTTSTPVSEAAQLRTAAEKVANLFYTPSDKDEPDSAPVIDVVGIIKSANQYNSEFADGVLTVTTDYPVGGNIVGSVTVALSGDKYTAATASADGTLDVDDYVVSATNLQIAEGTEYYSVSFSLTGPVDGVSLTGIKTNGSYTLSASSPKIYAPLPDQDASITLSVPVSYTMVEGTTEYTTEVKQFNSADLKTAVMTILGDASAYDPESYIDTVARAYLATIGTNLGTLFNDVETVRGGKTVEGLKATVARTVDASKSDDKTEVNSVVITITGDEYEIATGYDVTGTLVLTFNGTRDKSTQSADIQLGKCVITGSVALAGGNYPINVVSDADYPATAEGFSGVTVTLASASETAAISKLKNSSPAFGNLTGRADIEGITFTL